MLNGGTDVEVLLEVDVGISDDLGTIEAKRNFGLDGVLVGGLDGEL